MSVCFEAPQVSSGLISTLTVQICDRLCEYYPGQPLQRRSPQKNPSHRDVAAKRRSFLRTLRQFMTLHDSWFLKVVIWLSRDKYLFTMGIIMGCDISIFHSQLHIMTHHDSQLFTDSRWMTQRVELMRGQRRSPLCQPGAWGTWLRASSSMWSP